MCICINELTMKNNNTIKETWNYFKAKKKWWLFPLAVMLIIVGGINRK